MRDSNGGVGAVGPPVTPPAEQDDSLRGFAVSLWSPASVVWEVKEADVNVMHVQNCLLNTGVYFSGGAMCVGEHHSQEKLSERVSVSCHCAGWDDVMEPKMRSAGPWDSLSGTDGSSVEGGAGKAALWS